MADKNRKTGKLMEDTVYQKQAELCAALANPVRLKVLDLLAENEMTCKQIQETLGIGKTNLSQHLAVLKRAGLVNSRKEGVCSYVSLALPRSKEICSLLCSVLAQQAKDQAESGKKISKQLAGQE